jgi:hypothetical protein
MTSVTYGMRKSLCKVTFDMYQGALASFLNVLDWRTFGEAFLFGPSRSYVRMHNSVLEKI